MRPMAEADRDDTADAVERSLRGRLLIASPALTDPNFARAVVLITEHGEDGAMGVVLNRPSEIEVDDGRARAAPRWSTASRCSSAGRCSPRRWWCWPSSTTRAAAAWVVVDSVGFVAADTEYSDLPELVRRGRVYAGYSGWGAGQLEAELAEEAWIVEPPLPRELFAPDPEDLWPRVLERKGGQFALVARMPDDPTLN